MIIAASVIGFLVAFLAFTAAHIVLSLRLRRVMLGQHAAAWTAHLEQMSGDRGGALGAFVWSGRHRDLADPDLTRLIILVRWLTVGIVAAMAGAIFGWMPIEALLGGPPAA